MSRHELSEATMRLLEGAGRLVFRVNGLEFIFRDLRL